MTPTQAAAMLAAEPSWLDDTAAQLDQIADRHRGPSRARIMEQAERCRIRAGYLRRSLDAAQAQAPTA